MRFAHFRPVWMVLLVGLAAPLRAQIAPQGRSSVQFEPHSRVRQVPREPTGFLEHVFNGKLTLSLNDAIRLALANNTDIRTDEEAVETAKVVKTGSRE